MARVDKISLVNRTPEYYADFTKEFQRNPITAELERVTNDRAVKNSIEALLLTNIGERFYQPNVGSRIRASLFENMDLLSIDQLKESISECIMANEPRANLIRVDVTEVPEENGLKVDVHFSLINITGIQTVTIVVQRAR